MKRFIALILALIFMMSFSTIAFADDDEGELVKHEITIEVPAGSSERVPSGTRIWNQVSDSLESGYTEYCQHFIIPDRYFAYEYSATGSSSGTFSVALLDDDFGFYSGGSNYVNSPAQKNDWISVFPGEYYLFRVINNTSSTIYFTITYYSWNT